MYTIFAITASVLLGADDKKDLDKIQGTWEVIAAEQGGEKAPAEELKKVMFRLVIKGERFDYRIGDDIVLSGTFKLDDTKKPKTIDVNGADPAGKVQTSLGIYQFDGEKLRVCFVEKGDRPMEFVSKKGTQIMLMEYSRVKK